MQLSNSTSVPWAIGLYKYTHLNLGRLPETNFNVPLDLIKKWSTICPQDVEWSNLSTKKEF